MTPSLRGELERLHAPCCATTRVRENKCMLGLPKTGRWIALSGTRYTATHAFRDELCDVLLAWQDEARPRELAAVLELKAKATGAMHIRRQLQNGATVLERHAEGLDVSFAAVLVHGGMRTVEVRALRDVRVTFRGARVPVQTLRCGESVSAVAWRD